MANLKCDVFPFSILCHKNLHSTTLFTQVEQHIYVQMMMEMNVSKRERDERKEEEL
jgi:hypothetical protein